MPAPAPAPDPVPDPVPTPASAQPWDVHRLPPAEGRTFLVTGGNAGIGYFVAEQLAGTGADVVIGSRTAAKAEAATTAIRARSPAARLRHCRLDLGGVASVQRRGTRPSATAVAAASAVGDRSRQRSPHRQRPPPAPTPSRATPPGRATPPSRAAPHQGPQQGHAPAGPPPSRGPRKPTPTAKGAAP